MTELRVAAAQLAPVFMQRDATVAEACDAIAEAGRHGARLVAFPETFLPGHPYFALYQAPVAINAQVQALYREAVTVPSPATDALCAAEGSLGVTQPLLDALPAEVRERLALGGGNSAIVAPRGDCLAGPVRDGEQLLYADLDFSRIDALKAIVDSAGHYARPDVVRLWLDRGAKRIIEEV